MTVGLYLRSFCGFALQLVPCAVLLLLPFRENAFPMGKRKACVWMAAISLVFSLCYPLIVWLNLDRTANSNLDDNLYMLAAIAVTAAVYFRITRVNLMRKFSVLFIVISYAAVQFFLANMLMDFLPLSKQNMTYNDATLAAYLIVTVLLLPPVVLFMRSRVRDYMEILEYTAHCRLELRFLMAVLVIYLALNALYSALWIQLRDTLQLSFVYFIPFSLFLSVLLIFIFYFTINLSIYKARSAEQAVELARKIAVTAPDTPVVFLTDSDAYAIEAFSVRALHYVLKPMTEQSLRECLNRLEERRSARRRIHIVSSSGVQHMFFADELQYAQCDAHYYDLHLKNGTAIRVRMTQQEIKDTLGGAFLPISRGLVVNVASLVPNPAF